MAESIAGVQIPDSALAREATELVREAAPPLLFDHSRRVFVFGSLRGREQGLDFYDVADELAAENEYLKGLGLPVNLANTNAELMGVANA